MAANLNDTTPAASAGRVNVTWQKDSAGNVSASVPIGAALSFADNVTPSGTVNGTNAVFTLPQTPSPAASLLFHVNGVLQAETTDFSLATDTITCVTAPETGAVLKASYRY